MMGLRNYKLSFLFLKEKKRKYQDPDSGRLLSRRCPHEVAVDTLFLVLLDSYFRCGSDYILTTETHVE